MSDDLLRTARQLLAELDAHEGYLCALAFEALSYPRIMAVERRANRRAAELLAARGPAEAPALAEESAKRPHGASPGGPAAKRGRAAAPTPSPTASQPASAAASAGTASASPSAPASTLSGLISTDPPPASKRAPAKST